MDNNTTQHRRHAATMGAHAYALSWKHTEQDKRDAAAIAAFVNLRAVASKYTRILILAGLAS